MLVQSENLPIESLGRWFRALEQTAIGQCNWGVADIVLGLNPASLSSVLKSPMSWPTRETNSPEDVLWIGIARTVSC